MRPYKQKLLLAASLLILAVLLAAWLALRPMLGALKGVIEVRASESFGMRVAIGGRLSLSLFPGAALTLRDVSLSEAGKEVAKVSKVKIWLALRPLLRREVRINRVDFFSPSVQLSQGVTRVSRAKGAVSGTEKQPFTLKDIRVSGGRLEYIISESGEKITAGGLDMAIGTLSYESSSSRAPYARISLTGKINARELHWGKWFDAQAVELDANNFSYGGPSGEEPLRNLSYSGKLKGGTFKTGAWALTGIEMDLSAREGIFTASPLRLGLFGGSWEGSLKLDKASGVPLYALSGTLKDFRIEEFLKTLSAPKAGREPLEGNTNFAAEVSAGGTDAAGLARSLSGRVSLSGRDLLLHDLDIDAVISRFKRSQNFNLLDAGAFLLAGPIGPAITKSYNFANLALMRGKDGKIRQLASVWKVKNGYAETEDVALASKHHRLAMKGRINFSGGRFKDMTAAILDKRGCAVYSQKVNGRFAQPELGKLNMLESLGGPVLSVLGTIEKIVPGNNCAVFYSGSVPDPEN